MTIDCCEYLQAYYLLDQERVSQILIDLVPLSDDLLSLEQPENFKHYLTQDDDNYKVYVQWSIHRLESIFGQIPYKFGLGKNSKQIINRIASNTLNVDQTAGSYGAQGGASAFHNQ